MSAILIVTDAWYPQVNGVVTVFSKMKELLEKDGHQVKVIHPGLFLSLPLPFYSEIRLAFTTVSKIEKIIFFEKPDYIHIGTEGPLGFLARKACLHKAVSFTTSYHTHFPHYIKLRIHFLFTLTYAYLKWFHGAAERTFVATDGLRKELLSFGLKNIIVWPLGVDLELFKRNNTLPQLYAKPIFLYFGRIAVEKNVEEFLQTALPGTKLIVGDGPLRKKLEKKYCDDSTLFLGYKRGQNLVNIISQSDVFVFPSRTDTFGLVIIEALACGVPVAAHNVLGPKDIISQGEDGYLSDNLTQAALACLLLSKDKCREKASKYSWTNSKESFLNSLYRV